jgi:hypothetical protein
MTYEWYKKMLAAKSLKREARLRDEKESGKKKCSMCRQVLPLSFFGVDNRAWDKLYYGCKKCSVMRQRNARYKKGAKPACENKSCSLWLGVVVAERLLANVFQHVERMPNGNRGYDMICGRGKKVDVKISVLRIDKRRSNAFSWDFDIHRNKIAEYFACVAIDNRKSCTPLHFWLIPGSVVNHLTRIAISNSERGINKWKQYEQPLDKVVAACDRMKENGVEA